MIAWWHNLEYVRSKIFVIWICKMRTFAILGAILMRWAGPARGLVRLGEVIFILCSYESFYLTGKRMLRHCEKIVLIMWLLSGNFYIFSMDSRRLQQFHFTIYSVMSMINAFLTLLKSHGISLISLTNQKREHQTILNEYIAFYIVS